eukprot:TRINITY_DN41684_c0_g1_i1.p3 TRINITY_DN41684_c0_g1~~TRINITY_DN41684_c0_g1_i1.p3  ORF type:complete len:170 (+),score=19.35 TRINITY_DN41684_c0_g1_i1:44-511(+)
MQSSESRPPLPPFTEETAKVKVQAAEDAWNSRDAVKVSLAYTQDCKWRNRDLFFQGREAIQQFLTQKWEKELNYRLKKHYFCHSGNRIAVTFQYEYCNKEGQWFRAYGNEHWTFNESGLMMERNASINDVPIDENERQISDGKDVDRFATGTFLR